MKPGEYVALAMNLPWDLSGAELYLAFDEDALPFFLTVDDEGCWVGLDDTFSVGERVGSKAFSRAYRVDKMELTEVEP